MSIEYRVYDKIQKKYRTDLVVDSEWRVLLLEVNKREKMHNMHFTVEYWFRWIFEGDIVKTDYRNSQWTVKFLDHLWVFCFKSWIVRMWLDKLFDNKRKVEVIWNIHDESPK